MTTTVRGTDGHLNQAPPGSPARCGGWVQPRRGASRSHPPDDGTNPGARGARGEERNRGRRGCPGAGLDRVVAPAGPDGVRAGSAIDRVVAAPADDEVVAAAAGQVVVAAAAD